MSRQDFVKGYTKVLTSAWSDESFASRLQSDPTAVLDESGLSLPADTQVSIVTEIAGSGDLDDQFKMWEEGISSGSVTLYVPSAPQIETGELSEAELESVAGGTEVSLCCCCCPCCTST